HRARHADRRELPPHPDLLQQRRHDLRRAPAHPGHPGDCRVHVPAAAGTHVSRAAACGRLVGQVTVAGRRARRAMNRLDTGAAAMPVIRAEAHRLRMALKRPYDNALGRLDAFDVIVVALDDGVGRVGWGEACPVAGYSPESPDEAWAYTGRILPGLL